MGEHRKRRARSHVREGELNKFCLRLLNAVQPRNSEFQDVRKVERLLAELACGMARRTRAEDQYGW